MNSVGGIFHNESVYKIITLYTLSILQFCQLYLSKAEKKKHMPLHLSIDYKSVC